MKMHVLTVAVLAALASRAVLAASEGGDTWSAVEPVQKSTYQVLQYIPRFDPPRLASDDASKGSEGGDTWSSVQALRETPIQQAGDDDYSDRNDPKYASQFGGSEGGDTWSRFVPQFQKQPVGSAGMASARSGNNDHWQPPFGE